MLKELIDLNDPNNIEKLIKEPAKCLTEFVTGVLVSDSIQHKWAASRLIHASLQWNFLTQLGKEINDYRKRGIIKDNFLESEKNRATFSELLKSLEEETPDQDKFEALKSLFLLSVSSEESESDQILAHEFLKICKQLKSGELLVLKATYDLYTNNCREGLVIENASLDHATIWLKLVSQQIGHDMPSLVQLYETSLMDLHLISGRVYSDLSGVNKKDFRLTETGIKFCEFITKYQSENN